MTAYFGGKCAGDNAEVDQWIMGKGTANVIVRLFEEEGTHAVLEITPGERLALQLLAQEGAAAEIAKCLGVADDELGPHLDRLFTKMGASTRAEAVATARRRGLLYPRKA
jgi:DNA-binding CsgD family transcriptional regulator